MRVLGAYLRRHWKLLLLLAGCLGICSAVFSLYDLPLESVGYAFALCLALGLVLFAVGYVQFLRRHRELERLLVQVREKVLPLPPPGGFWRRTTRPCARPWPLSGRPWPWRTETGSRI